jgi:hypothetical protein
LDAWAQIRCQVVSISGLKMSKQTLTKSLGAHKK